MKAKNSAWIILLAAACFGLGFLVRHDTHSQPVNAGKPISNAQAQPLFAPVTATLEQQKMCSEQATKAYREYLTPDSIPRPKGEIGSYTSHYDPAVNVCYIRVDTTSADKVPMNSAVVYDAFGGRVYATYTWINTENKKFWEVSPTDCEIHIPGKPDETCKSSDDFNELTEKYFGVAP
jgi:hypothetical protein